MAFDLENTCPNCDARLGKEGCEKCGIDINIDSDVRALNMPIKPLQCGPRGSLTLNNKEVISSKN